MKTMLYVALLVTVLCAGLAGAVPPAYTGQFGNAEEPALRPVKWTWVGVKSLVQSTKDGLASGVEKDPASMVGEGAVGSVKGTGNLVSSVGHGIVGAPLPPKKDPKALSYEEAAMVIINNETGKNQPEQEAAQPAVADQAQAQENDPGAKFRTPAPSTVLPVESKAEFKPIVIEESNVEKAQRTYVPLQSSYRSNRRSDGTGNLLNMAK